VADPGSMIAAVLLAARLATQRARERDASHHG